MSPRPLPDLYFSLHLRPPAFGFRFRLSALDCSPPTPASSRDSNALALLLATRHWPLATVLPTPLYSILTQNRVCNPCRINTYISKGLKVLWNEYLRKTRGVGERHIRSCSLTPLLATLTGNLQKSALLSPLFATLTKTKDFKSFICHSYAKPGVGGRRLHAFWSRRFRPCRNGGSETRSLESKIPARPERGVRAPGFWSGRFRRCRKGVLLANH